MDRSSSYFKQVQLLVRLLPFVAKESCFALKGGTAINLFVRDLPRLSVDIDLVYLPLESRDETLDNVKAALDRIAARINQSLPNIQIQKAFTHSDALRMVVSQHNVRVKIELSPVLRGSVFPPKNLSVRPIVEETFGYAELPVLTVPDLYAGKICATLDRQHPRDLFDIKLLLENEGISNDLRQTFLVYLISHNRPMAELLGAPRKDIQAIYESEFQRMAREPVSLEELYQAWDHLLQTLHAQMTNAEREFLLAFKSGAPDWSLLPIQNVENLPAVQWKHLNLERMEPGKREKAIQGLRSVLYPNQA
jgi:predicted nucleotidyltransferase component of viral defense system